MKEKMFHEFLHGSVGPQTSVVDYRHLWSPSVVEKCWTTHRCL